MNSLVFLALVAVPNVHFRSGRELLALGEIEAIVEFLERRGFRRH